jgi:hypothetical protein
MFVQYTSFDPNAKFYFFELLPVFMFISFYEFMYN